jgi:hypothetical protein
MLFVSVNGKYVNMNQVAVILRRPNELFALSMVGAGEIEVTDKKEADEINRIIAANTGRKE